MATTLRLNEAIFREAKAEAARSGMTLTRFIEDSLRQRLGRKTSARRLPVFDSGLRLPKGFDSMSLLRDEEKNHGDWLGSKVAEPDKPYP